MYSSIKRAYVRLMIRRLLRSEANARRTLPAEFGGLPPQLWNCSVGPGGGLLIGGLDAGDLASSFGTPLQVVDVERLRQIHDDFLGSFTRHYPATRLATSYKTNPVPFVIAKLHGMGTRAEVISDFELWLARRLGLTGDTIIVNGPGKSAAMIEHAVDIGVRMINIDGPGEIDQIAAAAERRNRVQPVGVRVVTSVGWSSQFGLSIADGAAFAAFEAIARKPSLVASGVHLHLGTGIKSVDTYLKAIREVLDFAREIRQRLGLALSTFDLGGGFGVPTVRSMDAWDVRMVAAGHPSREAIPHLCPTPEQYARQIALLFKEHFPDPALSPEIVLEPGRAITSGAQTLLLRVVAVKTPKGAGRQLILDGGKNITMPLGWETHRIFPASRMLDEGHVRCDLFGPLCHPGDVIAQHLLFPALDIGDPVAVMDAGAYFIPNQMNFSNPRPAIVAIEHGEPRLVRARESYDDVIRLDQWAPSS